MSKIRFIFISLFSIVSPIFSQQPDCFVTIYLEGELGNNLFNIAVASALAWDHNAVAYFPDLATRWEANHPANVFLNYQHVFFRCPIELPPELKNKSISAHWREPSFGYNPIAFQPNMILDGFFQSEKYFAHHREKLLELFAPPPEDFYYILYKYQQIVDHPSTVGIQIREIWEDPDGLRYPQYGKDFIRKAAALFSSDSLFVITSNNVEFAKKNIPEEMKNYIIIENEPDYIDFTLLRLCKHQIIPNSTFGWWAAWLNENPDKIIVAPSKWFYVESLSTEDLLPKNWVQIKANCGPRNKFETYQ